MTKINYVETKDTKTFKFSFIFESNKYWGWVNPDTEEFKLNKENDKEIETLGWKYYVPRYQADEECDGCNPDTCHNCPCSKIEQAGWEYNDLACLLIRSGIAEEIDECCSYENVVSENLRNDLRILVRGLKNKNPKQIEVFAKTFNWEWYPREQIIAVCKHFSSLGNHDTWRNYHTAELDDPAIQAGKTNTELMVMMARAVSTVSKKIELGDTNSPWGDFTF